MLMLALVLSTGANAQSTPSYKIEGTRIVVADKAKSHEAKPATKTAYVYSKGGVDYPVYQSAKGALFIIRTSAKSGKEYKQYLPKEMQEELKKRIK